MLVSGLSISSTTSSGSKLFEVLTLIPSSKMMGSSAFKTSFKNFFKAASRDSGSGSSLRDSAKIWWKCECSVSNPMFKSVNNFKTKSKKCLALM